MIKFTICKINDKYLKLLREIIKINYQMELFLILVTCYKNCYKMNIIKFK